MDMKKLKFIITFLLLFIFGNVPKIQMLLNLKCFIYDLCNVKMGNGNLLIQMGIQQ